MDIQYNEAELAFRDEVRAFVAEKLLIGFGQVTAILSEQLSASLARPAGCPLYHG